MVEAQETTLRIASAPNFAKIVNLGWISRVVTAAALIDLCFCAGAFDIAKIAFLDPQTIRKRKWLHFHP